MKVWGLVLGRVGGVLKLSWPVLGVSCRLLGVILGDLGPSWALKTEPKNDPKSISEKNIQKFALGNIFSELQGPGSAVLEE